MGTNVDAPLQPLQAAAARQGSRAMRVPLTGFRANAGIMNPGQQAVVVTSVVRMPDGTVAGKGPEVTVPGGSMIQLSLPALMGANVPVESGLIEFNSTGPVFTYASMADNRTGDQFFIPGQKDDDEVRPLPQP